MKQFFTVVFGGLAAICIGILIAYGGGLLWKSAKPHLTSISLPISIRVSSHNLYSKNEDVETISDSARTIRFTADEEEDLLTAATYSWEQNQTSEITAPAFLVANLTTGESVVARNDQKIVPIASVTKLITAVIARKVIEPEERITIGKKVMAAYGNTAQFRAGEIFQARDLYYPLLMVSSNDAAEAFALAHGKKDFVRLMNDFAQSIGAYQTYFVDPSGLSAFNISSAQDLALIINWIQKNDPEILAMTTEKSRTVRAHTWVNPTHFLSWSTYRGGKNGYTPEANRTSVSLFTHGLNKDLYAVVVLGSEMRDRDVVTLLQKLGK